jgi:hypothetical protein
MHAPADFLLFLPCMPSEEKLKKAKEAPPTIIVALLLLHAE